MKDRNFKKKVEVIKELAKEPIVEKVEVVEPVKVNKKSFYFIVRSPFGDFRKGDRIDDEESIEYVIDQRLAGLCIKVFHK